MSFLSVSLSMTSFHERKRLSFSTTTLILPHDLYWLLPTQFFSSLPSDAIIFLCLHHINDLSVKKNKYRTTIHIQKTEVIWNIPASSLDSIKVKRHKERKEWSSSQTCWLLLVSSTASVIPQNKYDTLCQWKANQSVHSLRFSLFMTHTESDNGFHSLRLTLNSFVVSVTEVWKDLSSSHIHILFHSSFSLKNVSLSTSAWRSHWMGVS